MTLHYLYTKTLEAVRLFDAASAETVNKMAHETLALTCHEGLKGTGEAYGNLFAQVDALCKRCAMGVADRVAIQTMRRHTNGSERIERADFMYDMMALCRFISAVTGCDVPEDLLRLLPSERKSYERREGLDVAYVRCIVTAWDDEYIYVTAERGLDGGLLAVDCSVEHLLYLRNLLREGLQLNLLDCKLNPLKDFKKINEATVERVVEPSVVVVEPDYLLDISSIAACFKDYGHHELNYTLDRMRPRANSSAILLGNLAGGVLDDVINAEDGYNLADSLRTSFAEKAIEYSTCPDFNPTKFKADAIAQADNIKEAVDVMFSTHERRRAVLEPSFICERLGLQGRVDLMTTDFSLLVEQKSGRNWNIEHGGANAAKGLQLEPHYVQLLLYYGVLKYNFHLGFDSTDIRLLYSKYPPQRGLVVVNFYRTLFREAIRLRNMIVASDYKIATEGFESVLPSMLPEVINTADLNSSFFQKWLLPQIEAVTRPLQAAEGIEREYLCRMMTFVFREQLYAKVGAQEGVSSCAADLWNMPLAEKIETGNIYIGLRITRKKQAEGSRVADRITLAVPQQGEAFLPNFRRGDMVYLYKYDKDGEPDARKALLYKASIAELHTNEVSVVLTNGQQNPEILAPTDGDYGATYAIEHAASDMTAANGAQALHEFITSPKDRRQLLLGQREPRLDASRQLSRSYHDSYDDILLQAKQALDYYLLLGPPGTGKTSMALRFMVEEELTEDGSSILLMAYTNRAVDEICAMLEEAGIEYLRLGNEYTCDPRFKPHLLGEAVKRQPRLQDIRRLIADTRVITATTSMLMSRPFIFNIKSFSLAIVDEASQILEPNIIGLLAAHRTMADGLERNVIRRFVLVGDHKQLPAVVQQSESESIVNSKALNDICLDNCRNSLFERLLRWERKCGRKEYVGVLRKHGRMHPKVASFPCQEFYAEEQLKSVPLPHQREKKLHYADIGLHDALDEALRTQRMMFIPSPMCRRPDVSDKVNEAEAVIVAELLSRIRRMVGDGFDANKTVGVIVPYRNQIAVIRKEIEKLGMAELEAVSIDTVERYQGSQREVIIYSFTVQNPWQLEFLAGNCFIENGRTIDRKLNVALTRARRQMIMTGNEETLNHNALFREMIGYVRAQGGVFSMDNGELRV